MVGSAAAAAVDENGNARALAGGDSIDSIFSVQFLNLLTRARMRGSDGMHLANGLSVHFSVYFSVHFSGAKAIEPPQQPNHIGSSLSDG